uniref:Putative exonuclease mut-7 n=1 Tax=Ornithodoros turicata TaxID=34597 RepID=A0A2R5L7H9_9ACAR
MAQGLGRQLRLCGINTIILEDRDYHDEAVKYALKENRVILTSGAPYEKLKQYVSQGQCFKINTLLPAKEQLVEVLKHFKVVVSEDNLMSRCTICNGPEYVFMPQADMIELCTAPGGPDVVGCSNVRSYRSHVLNMVTGCFENGVKVQCQSLPVQSLSHVDTFFICVSCGKVYWEGSHHRRIKQQMRLSEFMTIPFSQPTTSCQEAVEKH